MNFRKDRRDEVELNITPLIDVVFLLLIFFMVTTTFQRESELNITLPKASKEVTEPKVDKVEVAVDAQERTFINGQELINAKVSTIREALRDATHDMHNPTVIIMADARSTHQSVIRVMDAARQIGLVRITFETQKDDASD